MKRLLLVPCLALVGMAALIVPKQGMSQPALLGSKVPNRVAPSFQLTDQWGRRISLSQFRGRPVLLTFLEAHCQEQCPLVAEKIRDATWRLDRAAHPIGVLAVSMDPKGDTHQAVLSFSRAHGLLHRWHYLTGSRRELVAVWDDYHVYGAPSGSSAQLRDMHTSATYLIDAGGRQRVLLGGDPDLSTLVRDLRILSGLPVNGPGSSMPAPQVGSVAPGFSLADLSGRRRSLQALRGKVVLLNFWAVSCPPCRSELPRLDSWYRRLRAQNLVVLGVDKGDSAAQVRKFVRSLHVVYPVVLDTSGTASSQYDLVGLPATFLVDREGTIRSRHWGAVDEAYLRSTVEPALR